METNADAAPQELSPDDIEAAYARALEAVDAVEIRCPVPEDEDPIDGSLADAVSGTATEPIAESSPATTADFSPTLSPVDTEPLIQPRQILEAALFVGGEPLTSRRLGQLLGEHTGLDRVADLVDDLNRQYLDEARPYEICFGEGGYRLSLRSEFEPIRDRVYGAGPRDVKLSQDVLEALAFVAYRQPTTRDALEAAGKANAASLLQQLLRRQLIALHRDEDSVTYSTTSRFLEAFGLRNLQDLPMPEDLEFK